MFINGVWNITAATGTNNILSWTWTLGSVKRLVVVNYHSSISTGRIKLPNISGSGSVVVKELISNQSFNRNAEEIRNQGLHVVVNAYTSQIFEFP